MYRFSRSSIAPIEWILFSITAFFWSTSFFIIRIAVHDIQPLTLTMLRLLVASLILIIVLIARSKHLPMDRTRIFHCIVIGLIGNALPFSLINWGEQFISSSQAALLMGTMPIVTTVLAHYFVPGEHFTPAKIAGISLGFAGVVTLFGSGILGNWSMTNSGLLAVFIAATSYGLSTIYVKLKTRAGNLEMATGVTLSAFLMMLPCSLLLERPEMTGIPVIAWSCVIYLGIFPTALSTLIYFRLIQSLGPSRFAYINYIIPLLGAIWGVVFLSESITPRMLVAMILVFAGIWLISRTRQYH